MPYWPDKHQTWGFFSVCAFRLWGPCVGNTRLVPNPPTNTYDIKQQLRGRAFFFCDFSIFQEEPLKDFGYNWFLLNRFVFMDRGAWRDILVGASVNMADQRFSPSGNSFLTVDSIVRISKCKSLNRFHFTCPLPPVCNLVPLLTSYFCRVVDNFYKYFLQWARSQEP